MQLAEAKPKKKVNKKRWIEQRAINVPIVEAMKVGDVHVFELPQGEDINAFRSLICNIARATFGGDREDPNYTSCSNKENTQIELLRIA